MDNTEYEQACENDGVLKATFKANLIVLYIYIGVVVLGLILYFVFKSSWFMLLCWALGVFSNFYGQTFMRDWLSRCVFYVRKNIIEKKMDIPFAFLYKIFGLIFALFGAILVFCIIGLFSPVMIVVYLIRILLIKKKIADNNEILSRFNAENSQNSQN